ncbi:gliding motility protein GldM [Bacteroidia bacterium]|nr:gliding motility protein GldM [Bacteroidia bacterium]
MAGAKETPRQKMIGMMYLVLTAMLALNVSSSVLQSFLTVNDSLEATNSNFAAKVESTYAMFDKAYLSNKEKVQENYDKAQQAKILTNRLIHKVDSLKFQMVAQAERISYDEAKSLPVNKIGRQDDFDTPTNFFIGDEIGKSRGQELREAIEQYEKDMLALVDSSKREQLAVRIDMGTRGAKGDGKFIDEHGEVKKWEYINFYHSVIVAACAILNKIENDALNAQYDIVSELYSAVSEDDFKFDHIDPRVVAASNYVLLGDVYEAEVFVAAYDSKSKISATVGGSFYQGENGVVKLRIPATSEGLKKLAGTIRVPGVNGMNDYPFSAEYLVAPPSATVSAESMNVFYIGIDNPVSVAVSGMDANAVNASISQGSITRKSGNTWVANVTSTGKATVTVTAKDGGKKFLVKDFRVKKVPDPIAVVNGFDEYATIVDKNEFASSQGLKAFMKDFDFELNPPVKSFKMQTNKGADLIPYVSNNNRFTADMTNAIKTAKKGQVFFFTEIVAGMPTGDQKLRNFNLTIK